jgi:uncharacterized PurR-regulated membrane protein YhhQ (DUF165 family)
MPDLKTDWLPDFLMMEAPDTLPEWLRTTRSSWACIFLFVGAVVAANLLVYTFGPIALPFTAFVLIPFDLVARDVLHEKWAAQSRKEVYTAFLLLICTAGMFTVVIHPGSGWVVAGSVAGFTGATLANTVGYDLILHYRPDVSRFWRMTISNVFGAAMDSLLFPLVAFGAVGPWIAVSQWGSKSIGGVVWALLYIIVLRYSASDGSSPLPA